MPTKPLLSSTPTPTASAPSIPATPPAPRWRKRILVPCWLIRLTSMILLVGLYIVAIGIIAPLTPPAVSGVAAVFLTLLLLCLALDLVAIVRFARGRLRPGFFLIANAVQAAIWLGVVGMEAAGYVQGERVGVRQNPLGVGGSVGIACAYVGPLVYAAVLWRRSRVVKAAAAARCGAGGVGDGEVPAELVLSTTSGGRRGVVDVDVEMEGEGYRDE